MTIDRTIIRSVAGRPVFISRYIIALILSFICLTGAFAQERTEDVIYLNNGTFIRGMILEMTPGGTLKVLTGEKYTLVVQMDEVKSIKKEPVQPVSGSTNEGKSGGYTLIVEFNWGFGALEGLQRYTDSATFQYSVGVSAFNGVTITPYIQLGVGAGLNLWRNRGLLPLYLDLRANILKKWTTPYLYFDLGYSLGWMSGQRGMGLGGATLGLGAGMRARIGNRRVIVVSCGYCFQETRQWIENFGVESKATRDAELVLFRLGTFF